MLILLKGNSSTAYMNGRKRFSRVPSPLYTTDVKLHHASRPQSNQQKRKLYYDGKHRLYGYKTEVLVSANALLLMRVSPTRSQQRTFQCSGGNG